ncbi:MAG: transketolase C-terminal domain-containing protein, partial [Betaproteobacteria bacterium]
CEGLKPVVANYSTFQQRGYDQHSPDVCIQCLPVVFALDRGGIVGADGPTHHGAFDLSYLRCLPHMVVMAPSDEDECRQMLFTAFSLDVPAAVRYPRGGGPGTPLQKDMRALLLGKAVVRRQGGGRVAILAFGSMVAPSLAVAQALDATVADMRFVKPLDEALVAELAAGHDLLVTVEENALEGGAGSAVLEALAREKLATPVLRLGLPDAFVEHGDPALLLSLCGLDAAGIRKSIEARLHR